MELLHSMYCDLLKRLDDSSDEIRMTMTKTLIAYTELVSVDCCSSVYYVCRT